MTRTGPNHTERQSPESQQHPPAQAEEGGAGGTGKEGEEGKGAEGPRGPQEQPCFPSGGSGQGLHTLDVTDPTTPEEDPSEQAPLVVGTRGATAELRPEPATHSPCFRPQPTAPLLALSPDLEVRPLAAGVQLDKLAFGWVRTGPGAEPGRR